MSPSFLHTMVRVGDLGAALKFYCDGLGLTEITRFDNEAGRFTLVFLASPTDIERLGGVPAGKRPTEMDIPMVELTHNWDEADYGGGRMTFIRSPDGISIELLQKGEALAPKEPWASAPNVGAW